MHAKCYVVSQQQEATTSLVPQQGQDDVYSDQQTGKLKLYSS